MDGTWVELGERGEVRGGGWAEELQPALGEGGGGGVAGADGLGGALFGAGEDGGLGWLGRGVFGEVRLRARGVGGFGRGARWRSRWACWRGG